MNPNQIIFAPAAEREIKKLNKQKQTAVATILRKFRDSSETINLEKIKGHPSYFRIKAKEDMRIIFHPLNGRRVVILVVRDRKDAYRGLDALDSKLEAALNRIQEEAEKHIVSIR